MAANSTNYLKDGKHALRAKGPRFSLGSIKDLVNETAWSPGVPLLDNSFVLEGPVVLTLYGGFIGLYSWSSIAKKSCGRP